ncbi:hypothetical protein E1161_03445 [Saccharopolyspora aridisoli]|uniref:Resuscitation-promoting factor core lysozyme-like domain-containing protein n=1 Tax=Saccharopolyspora aridisoli TaxID=2530385 RepID=A0A4R4UTT2_9PSEU|nr:hypothetical protein E1161_03445 [Saccharopolyspora aridisoli]
MQLHRFTKWTVAVAVAVSGSALVAVTPNAAAAPNDDRAAVWDRLARCESGGDWAANTGNGYYGGLQFNRSTWVAHGGERYNRYPHRASREQQIAIAQEVHEARGGYGAWPACSRKLGLP